MKKREINILIVEDDSLTMQTSKRILSSLGKIFTASTEGEAHQVMANKKIDLAFLDLNLNGELSGLNLIGYATIQGIYPIVLSGEVDRKILETAFTNGAKDYLNKPFNNEKLTLVMNRFHNFRNNIKFENLINDSFITKSQALTEELYKIKNLSISEKPVFISGETGTGKRVVAHLIKNILEKDKFLEINCAQFSDELIASELFGHKRAAFTGATSDKIGLLEKADGGIVFLDEIHALSVKAQKLLLKAIEEKEFLPVGSDTPVKSDFRIISATCEDIEDLVDAGAFREDLYARINTFHINLSPIRKRPEDVMLLLKHFISKQLIQILITEEAGEILEKYSWPRNTREIQDIVENWVVHGHRVITPEVLPVHIRNNIVKSSKIISEYHIDLVEEMGLKEFITVFKKEILLEVLKRNKDVLKYAAKSIDTDPTYFRRFLNTNKDKSFIVGGQNGQH